MAYSQIEIAEYSRRIGKSVPTLWRWIRQGCDLRDPRSVREWQTRNEIRKTNIARARERRGKKSGDTDVGCLGGRQIKPQTGSEPVSNGELPPAGRKGAAAALERLECQEEEAHRRLVVALAHGNPAEIDAAQTFWLRCSETLRRLDLAVEVARRQEETQIPLKEAQDAITAASEWLRISVAVFLSSEIPALMGIKTVGEFKFYFMERFKDILDLTVKGADKTRSAIPDWAKERIKTAWNVDYPAGASSAGH
jgi:hypothetical protein